ncbi:MAG: hypothetical protein LBL00_09230, partial [Endomicrobium sp.]|nr:hypothetical protein [Endomicrobium sp.]
MKSSKTLSLCLSVILIFTASAQNFAAFPFKNPAVVQSNVNPLNDHAVFANYAKVTDFANYGGKNLILNIQDFHLNPEVQKNINSIIDILVKKYGIKNVFAEGGHGRVNTDWLSAIKDKNIIEEFLNEGLITASEYYAAFNGKEDFILGLEDEKIHDINVKRLAGIIELRPFYKKTTDAVCDDLEFLQSKYFNVKNKRFAEFVKRYKNGKIPPEKYYKVLFKHLKHSLSETQIYYDYPNASLFLQSSALQKRFNISKFSRSFKNIISKAKENLPFSSLPKNAALTDARQIFSYLNSLPENFQNIHFDDEIKNFIALQNLYLQINPVDLIKEERNAENEIRILLSEDTSELEISFLSDFSLYFADFMNASISAEDYEYFQKKFSKFESLWKKYSYYGDVLKPARPYLELLNAYYLANDKRNEIFLDVLGIKDNQENSLRGGESFEEVLSSGKNVSVVITGGYHSKGITEILKRKGISYAVITPYIYGETETTLKKYENLALERAGFPAQALALSLASQAADIKKAELLFNLAQKNLSGISYEEKNINYFIDKLNEISGGYLTFFRDGQTVLIDRDGVKKEFADILEDENGKI